MKHKRKRLFWVDIPLWPAGEYGQWMNVADFPTLREARKFLLDKWGIRRKYAELFITEGTP